MIEKKKGRRGGRKERKNKNNINHNHKNVPPQGKTARPKPKRGCDFKT